MELKPGNKVKPAGTTAEFIVIRSPGGALDLTCGAAPLNDNGSGGADAAMAVGTGELLIGKRYSDDDGVIELLCTQSGPGPLLLNGRALEAKAAKALPSSD